MDVYSYVEQFFDSVENTIIINIILVSGMVLGCAALTGRFLHFWASLESSAVILIGITGLTCGLSFLVFLRRRTDRTPSAST